MGLFLALLLAVNLKKLSHRVKLVWLSNLAVDEGLVKVKPA